MKYMLIHCIDESAERNRGPAEHEQGRPAIEDWLEEMDEAIEIASKHPTAWWGTIEVRPIAGDHCGGAAAG